jgi:hypothetical protein
MEVGVLARTFIGYRSHPHPGPPHKGEGNQRYTFMSQPLGMRLEGDNP